MLNLIFGPLDPYMYILNTPRAVPTMVAFHAVRAQLHHVTLKLRTNNYSIHFIIKKPRRQRLQRIYIFMSVMSCCTNVY